MRFCCSVRGMHFRGSETPNRLISYLDIAFGSLFFLFSPRHPQRDDRRFLLMGALEARRRFLIVCRRQLTAAEKLHRRKCLIIANHLSVSLILFSRMSNCPACWFLSLSSPTSPRRASLLFSRKSRTCCCLLRKKIFFFWAVPSGHMCPRKVDEAAQEEALEPVDNETTAKRQRAGPVCVL